MRPPRPEMSNAVPPPALRVESPPPLVRSVGALWLMGVVVGGAALVTGYLDRDAHLAGLRETAAGIDGAADPARLDQVAAIALWGTLALFAVVLVVEGLLVRPLLRGVGGVRWVLLVMLALDAGAVLLVFALLGDGSAGFQPTVHLAGLQLAVAALAFLLGLLPPASRWIRDAHSRR
ncbi:hypothetical protein [Arthrobacter antioxidans]|uniref:hypothetical protein n=1 Tax=Arthrobacter antioxidans TaxID=2895818 RepID=UPI001FFF20F1|nr:hypothetical protein [Arthrobacter antioxidans]